MADRIREPIDSREGHTPRLWVLALALLAAIGAAQLSPDPWPQGRGVLTLSGPAGIDSWEVEVGSTHSLELLADTGATVALPGGLPVDSPVSVVVGGAVGEADLALILPDGRSEPIPTIRSTSDGFEASRRPPAKAAIVLGLLAVVVVLWVSEEFPLWATSLSIPVVLAVAAVAHPTEALTPFFHPIIVLFFAGFLMAEAMRRTGLDEVVANAIVARFGRSPRSLFIGMLGLAAFLSMWMSNTAATAVLVPIAIAVTEPLHHLGFRKAVILGIAYAATIGGVGSAIGTPANPLAIEFLESFGDRSISFIEWFAVGLPIVALLLPVMAAYLWWRHGVRVDPRRFESARSAARARAAGLRLSGEQLTVLAVFVAVMAGWLTETVHGLSTGIVALAGAVALAALGMIKTEDLGRISWASLLTFGGGLSLGVHLVESGASDWVGTRLTGLSGAPEPLAVAAVAGISLLLTTVASNTASAAILIPLSIPLASVIDVDPTLLVLVVAVMSSVDFALVIGTPPTMIAYSTDLFTSPQIFRIGLPLDLASLALVTTAGVWFWGLLGII